ncbi:MAG: hypothetical protein J6S71_09155 [Clostridia bacterium]|nr:hypothetical protein [Clostridia bacterium]
MKKNKSVLWGIIFIAAGLIWALSALDIVKVDIFFDGWWTLFIIVPSAISLFTSSEKFSSAIGVAVGVILLLCARDILTYGMVMKLAVPAIIVLIGLKMIFSSFKERHTEKIEESFEKYEGDIDNVFCLFNGVKADLSGKVFRGAEINAIFGGVDYDLRGAVIEPDSAIKVSAIFGGVDIIVPEGVKVRVKSTAVFGGVSNKTRRYDKDDENVVTLYVSGLALFGGVDIK